MSGENSSMGRIEESELFKAFALFMKQHQIGAKKLLSTKALQAIMYRYDEFDGRNITKYLKVYNREMKINRVLEQEMIESFELAVVPELRSQVERIREAYGTIWEAYETALKEEFFDDDADRVTKRSFLEWVEQQPGKGMMPNELLREFEARFSQLSPSERLTLDLRKTELFLQAADDTLEDKLLLLLADRDAEGGIAMDWKKSDEGPKDGIAELRRKQTSPPPTTRKDFVRLCIWCDSPDHDRQECKEFSDALKDRVVFFKDGRIHLTETGLQIGTNFGKGGMKRLIETRGVGEARAFPIELCKNSQGLSVSSKVDTKYPMEVMVRGAEAFRQVTGWDDPVDATSVEAFVSLGKREAIVEEKRRRDPEEKPTEEAPRKEVYKESGL
ncbi:hypothetical protein R1flu_026401 [Riccia fluitans]|uniref:Uncharacterized protein n=1 Tax=Riccia fluitans TaxID=41844 RepID=A0ABD1XJX6_9MARC